MSSETSHLSSYRPAMIAVTGLATAYALYAVYTTLNSRSTNTSLRRSNAVRRTQRPPFGVAQATGGPDQPLGCLVVASDEGIKFRLNLLSEKIPPQDQLCLLLGAPPSTAGEIFKELVAKAVELILEACHHAGNDPAFDSAVPSEMLHRLRDDMVTAPRPEDLERYFAPMAEMLGVEDVSLVRDAFASSWPGIFGNSVTVAIADDNDDGLPPSAEGLKGLLYYIAEEQAMREGFEHRGIRCSQCDESPIRNIRWHCLNCPDYELCNHCKHACNHTKSHVFAEIKIPLPVLSQPVSSMPLWYPGDSDLAHYLKSTYRKRLSQAYGFKETEVQGLYDQFTCLANVGLQDDPVEIHTAINREAFNKALTSERWRHRFTPNVLYDRMFAFYDVHRAWRIGFEQFVSGVSYIRGGKRFESLRRALEGYDFNDDNLLSRIDILRLLRAKYEAQRFIVEETVECSEDEHARLSMETLRSSQPIGSTFNDEIPATQNRVLHGKDFDQFGDLVPTSGTQSVLEDHMGSEPSGSRSVPSFGELIRDRGDHARISRDATINISHVQQIGEILSEDERQVLGLSGPASEIVRQGRVASQEILWQVIEEALNETLDRLFKDVENRYSRVLKSTENRTKFRTEIDEFVRRNSEFAQQLDSGSGTDPLLATAKESFLNFFKEVENVNNPSASGQRGSRNGTVPTDIDRAGSLGAVDVEFDGPRLLALWRALGYGDIDVGELGGTAADDVRQTASSPPQPSTHLTEQDNFDGGLAEQHDKVADPTMPQNRPNADPSSNASVDVTRHADVETLDKSKEATSRPREGIRVPDFLLAHFAEVDRDQRRIQVRDGHPCLTFEEIEAIAVADSSGEVRGLIKSWLEWASF